MQTLALVVTITLLGLLAACQRQDISTTAASGGSTVRIIQLSPPTSSSLRVGDRVILQAEVGYSLSADSGVITLVVQASDNKVIANETEVVNKGTGKLTLKTEFAVPDTKAIQVFTPLYAQGQASTSTVDVRAYKVEPK